MEHKRGPRGRRSQPRVLADRCQRAERLACGAVQIDVSAVAADRDRIERVACRQRRCHHIVTELQEQRTPESVRDNNGNKPTTNSKRTRKTMIRRYAYHHHVRQIIDVDRLALVVVLN